MGFEVLLGAVIREEGTQNKPIDLERMKVLEKVYDGFCEVLGADAKVDLKLHPAFRTGGVTAKIPEVSFDKTKVLRLTEALSDCATFEVLPLTDGSISVTATVQRVFKDN